MSEISNHRDKAEYTGKAVTYRDNQGYEEQLAKWSDKLGIDQDWLRKSSYTTTGKEFLTYGDHYNNIVNFLSEKNTKSYIYLKDFKFRLISPNAFIDYIEKIYQDKEDKEVKEDQYMKDFDKINYHFLLYSDIFLNKSQWEKLMSITGLTSEELAIEQFCIRKDKAVLSGGSAKIIKVYTSGENKEEDMGYIKYDVDYDLYTPKKDKYGNIKDRSNSAALKYLPKTIKTRTMREALKQVYTFDFAMMAAMASMEIIDEVEVSITDSMSEGNLTKQDSEPNRTDLIAAKKAEMIKKAEEEKVKWTEQEADKAIEAFDTSVAWAAIETK